MARWIFLAGFTAYLVIGYFATFYEHGQAHWRNVRHVEGDLQAAAKAALTRLNATWARVKVEGQVATLLGEAPTEADREDAKRDVRAAAGPGGPWLGGITQVRDQTTVAAAVKPYVWSATRGADGRVTLRGYAPGQRYRKALNAEARKMFPTGVDDQTVIAAGHPTGLWAETATWALGRLSQLQSGEAKFVDATMTIRGQARDAAVQAAIYAEAKTLPRPYAGVAEITLSDKVALPEAPDESVTAPIMTPAVERKSPADCQKLVDEAMTNNILEFASGSANVKAAGQRLLDRMAQTAIDCGTLRFRITGHTDGSSLELGAGDLSGDRAEVVTNYLIRKGVAADRLVSVSAGASQPVGDNATREGQARNRRVEITVLP